jgi:prophage regulatory protein
MAVIPKRAEAEDGAALTSELRRMLNERQVLEIVPVSRATFFRMGKAGRFPAAPTYISTNRRVWFEDEIVAWRNAVHEFI